MKRRGLAAQAAVAMAAVVAISLVLTGVVALQLIRGAAERQALDNLDRQAQIIADLVRSPAELALPQRFVGPKLRLTKQGISLVTVSPDGKTHGASARPLTAADRATLLRGADFRGVRRRGGVLGDRLLAAGQPVAAGGAVVLLEPARVVGGVTADARRRILAALLAGLLGATAAGFLFSRRLARPLQRAASAANDLAGGRRDVRLQPGGPAEVAGLSAALNTLAGALATSEGRQREFLLSVSHELRTPLTAVKGFAEALADGVVPPSDVPATGATMLAESARLERLVTDLLDLARLSATDFALEFGPVELGELVREAERVWAARAAKARVHLAVELPAEPVIVQADPTRLRQILDGLAENALRATPAERPLIFAVRVEAADAVLEVRDGGLGLTEDDLLVAFERSALHDRYRGTRRVGTGVGLALVAGLAGRMGGRAEAGAAGEGGARFAVRLPRVLGSAAIPTGSAGAPQRQTIRPDVGAYSADADKPR